MSFANTSLRQHIRSNEADITAIQNILNSTSSILTSSLESPDQQYNLDELLTKAVSNKVKLETFVHELDGAIGDGNTGVVSLMQQVSQNIVDGAAEVTARGAAVSSLTSTVSGVSSLQISDNAARVSAIELINSTNTVQYLIEGEGSEPSFCCGLSYFDDNFGIPVLKAGLLQQIHYLAKSPDSSLTAGHTMTLDIEVWNAVGTKISTETVAFVNKTMVHTFGSAISLPAYSNIVVKYNSSSGVYIEDTRYRLALQVL
jgi:hypothetical protein